MSIKNHVTIKPIIVAINPPTKYHIIHGIGPKGPALIAAMAITPLGPHVTEPHCKIATRAPPKPAPIPAVIKGLNKGKVTP